MKSGLANKAVALVVLLVFVCCQAQPLQEGQSSNEREKRQMKTSTGTEAELKMLATNTANATPTATAMPMQLPMGMGLGMSMGMPQMPFSPLAINAGMQLARFPSYPGLIYGPGVAPGAAQVAGLSGVQGLSGLQTNLPNPYSNYEAGLAGGAANGFGLSYPGNAHNFMYGNVYPNAQLSNGYGQPTIQPSVDNFAALNNYLNMANAQGLSGSSMPTSFYAPQAAGGPMSQQLSPFGYGGANMNAMNAYAPAF